MDRHREQKEAPRRPSPARSLCCAARSKWVKVGVLVALGFILITVMLRWFEQRQVYFPDGFMTATGAELSRPYEDVFFPSAGTVRLNGWFFPAEPQSPRASLVILYCHGNAGNISYRLEICRALLETGVAVFLFDYRGYGRSTGRPSEEGTCLDAVAAYQWLLNKGFAPTNIIAYGESLGGGVATELATRRQTGGLVLQSTFTSLPELGAELFPWLPVRWLSTIQYRTLSKLPRLHVPVVVMHSRQDELIGFHHAERNFAAAPEPKLFCELKGGHNHPLADRDRYIAGIESFLRLIRPPGTNGPAERSAPAPRSPG